MDAVFTFATQWWERDEAGLLREYVEQHRTAELHEARRMHSHACEGLWVRPETVRPYVSPLRVRKWGRLLEEELAPGKDLPEHGKSVPPALGPDPRTDPGLKETLGKIVGRDAA